MKTNILIECPTLLPSVRVGVLEPLRPGEEQGRFTLRYKDTKDIRRKDISWCDILITVRGSELPTLRIVKAARDAGRMVIYFLDDDLLNIPDLGKKADTYRDQVIRKNLPKILPLCHVLWTVNKRLAEKYSVYCARSVCARVPAEVVSVPPREKDVFRVVYAASKDHQDLAREYITPAALRLVKEFPGRICFTFIGPDPGVRGVEGVEFRSFFPSYADYREAMRNGRYSLGVAPARRTDFFGCKYYNKYIEYSSFAIPGIYSDCEPYTQVIRDGENGFLCPDGALAWYAAIRRCLEHPELGERCAAAAGEDLREHFSHPEVLEELLSLIPELETYRAPRCSPRSIRLRGGSAWLDFYWERARLFWRNYRWKGLFLFPWKVMKVLAVAVKDTAKGLISKHD